MPSDPNENESHLSENSARDDGNKNSRASDGTTSDASKTNMVAPGKSDLEVVEQAMEDARQFNQGLLAALQNTERSNHIVRLDEFTGQAPDLARDPVSFNEIINYLLGHSLDLNRIIDIFLRKNQRPKSRTVFSRSSDDVPGFEKIVRKMIAIQDEEFAEKFIELLIGEKGKDGFLLGISAENVGEAAFLNEVMLSILIKFPDAETLRKINAYCQEFSVRHKIHEASYIPLLNKISKLERQNK